MRSMAVVMVYVFGEDNFELASGEDQDPVEALPTDGPAPCSGCGLVG
jgi:hypothetical protein